MAVGEVVKPLFHAELSPTAIWPDMGLSLLFLVLGTLHLTKLRTGGARAIAPNGAEGG